MAGARYIRWHFAARRADCAAASSRQAHRRAAVSRRRRLDGEGARRATITWLQMAPPNDAEHMLTILLFFNRRADGARPVHSIRSRRALLTHRAPPSGQTSCDERFSYARRPTRSHYSDRRGISAQCPNRGRLTACVQDGAASPISPPAPNARFAARREALLVEETSDRADAEALRC